VTPVISEVADGLATVTLNRPEQMNAVTAELGAALHRAIDELGSDPQVNVIAIRGSGGNFCAGGDFGEVERLRAEGPEALKALFVNFTGATRAIAGCRVPVIAVVDGVAMAGGFELMQAADLALVSSGARISDNHIRFGQIPGGGSSQRLARLVGRQQALGLLLSGDRLSGDDAVRLGLAYKSWPDEHFADEAAQFLRTLAGRPRAAVTTIKRLVLDGLDENLDDGLDAEIEAVVRHISGAAGEDGVTAFSERSGRR